MSKQLKVAKLLAPTVPLVLAVEDVPQKLELRLAWTMRSVVLVESKLYELGININALQNPAKFWTELDCTKLSLGVWAMSNQEHPEYRDDEGYDTILSFIVPENYGVAAKALKDCFLESLSKKRREDIRTAEAVIEETTTKADPIPAPDQPLPQ